MVKISRDDNVDSLRECQELDCSGLLSVSKTVVLWNNKSVVQWTVVQRRAQSSNWIDDERDSGIVKK